ncbi:MAG: capsular biosynthesis protein [Candidatus Methylopumilus sp.]|nr:capsular biosynthesis protein [Candidatus Methylopumilus sp.]
MGDRSRSFLLLQGVSSPFFSRLATALSQQGHRVHKVSFNAGDVVYWLPRRSNWFKQDLSELPDFLHKLYAKHGITDQVVFGDRRPVHIAALEQARQNNVRNHVFEEGYFRPNLITLEQEGVNARSQLPRSPTWFTQAAQHIPPQPSLKDFRSRLGLRAMHDIAYQASGVFNRLLFSKYRSHHNMSAAVEYAGYIQRSRLLKRVAAVNTRQIENLVAQRTPYFFVPLQLNSDSQVRDHERFHTMQLMLKHVLQSFAQHAPADTKLVIKNHPLDTGWEHYDRVVLNLEHQFGLKDRVVYLETGDLATLLKHAQGTITLNSTVGYVALEQGCPTHCLGDPQYNLPGLTDQQDLAQFWGMPVAPEAELFQSFKRVVVHSTQVYGGFYCPPSIAQAVQGSCERLAAELSPLQQLLSLVPI